MGKRAVVLGGGISGLCTAWYLTRRGIHVTVIERGRIGDSASGGNAGILAAGHPPLPRPGLAARALRWTFDRSAPLFIPPRCDPALWRWFLDFRRACTQRRFEECLSILAPLGRLAMDCWREILAETEPDCDFRPVGWLNVYRTKEGRREAEDEADAVARYGYAVARYDGDELRRREPAFRDDVLGAVHYLDSASVDPRAFLEGFARRLVAEGATLHEEVGTARPLLAGGRCLGVRLASGEEIRGAVTVLAAGAWSVAPARAAGWRLPQQGGKGYHLDLTPPSPRLNTAAVLAERFVAVTPMGDRLRLSGTVEFSGLNRRLHARRVEMLAQGARLYLRGVDDARELDRGCDLRPCTADGLPVLGAVPRVDGLFAVTGGAKMGMTLGPACGRLAAELLTDGRASLDVSLLRADRFR